MPDTKLHIGDYAPDFELLSDRGDSVERAHRAVGD
jgi:hypothetical protein